MATIQPKFDFSPLTPTYSDGQNHTEARDRKNALRPELFNEFERIMVEACDVIGDYSVNDTIPGSPNNLGGALRYSYQLHKTATDTLNSVKFDKAGGTITGDVTMQQDLTVQQDITSILDVNVGQDLDVTRDASIGQNLDVTGRVDITSYLTVDTDLIYVDVPNQRVGIDCVPTAGKLQVNGELLPFVNDQGLGASGSLEWKIYATSLYVDSDLIYAANGTGVVGIECNTPTYTLDVAGDIRIQDTYALLFGGTAAAILADMTAYDNVGVRYVDLTVNYATDDQTVFRVRNSASQDLVVIWQSSNVNPTFTANASGRLTSGRIYNQVWNDIAETVPSDGSTEPGDLLMIDVEHPTFRVTKYDGVTVRLFLGIQSKEPGYVVGWNDEYEHPVYLTLKGMVYINVPEGFKCNKGDVLILTMRGLEVARGVHLDPTSTKVVGTVIEKEDSGVKVFV